MRQQRRQTLIGDPFRRAAAATLVAGAALAASPAAAQTFTIADATVSENVGTASFAVTPSAATTSDVSVTCTVVLGSGATAATAEDLSGSRTDTVNFPTGTSTAGNCAFTIVNNFVVENSKTFAIQLSSTSSGVTATDTATVTIRNDDSVIIGLGATTGTFVEGEDIEISVLAMNGQTAIDLPVTLQRNGVSGADSVAAADFRGGFRNVSATFSAAQFQAARSGGAPLTFTLTSVDDSDAEGVERFALGLSIPSGIPFINLNPQTGIYSLADNDSVRVGLAAPTTARAVEGASFAFPVTLRGGTPARDITVTYEITGSGVSRDDFVGLTALSGLTATFTRADLVAAAGGGAPLTIDLASRDDGALEGEESFTVSLTAVTTAAGAVALAQAATAATATLADNELEISLTGPAGPIHEGGEAIFSVRRVGPTASPVTVTYGVSGVDAADFDDPGRGTVTIPAGRASAPLRLAILDDGVDENDETLQVTLSAVSLPPGVRGTASIGANASATARIARLSIAVALSGPETAQEGATARFALALTTTPAGTATTADLVLAYTVGAPGDTATRGVDYTAPAGTGGRGTLRLPAGVLAGTLEVPVLRDGVVEGEEIFAISLDPGRTTGGGGVISFAGSPRLAVRILDGTAAARARREERTRAMLGVVDRAAALLATEIIAPRFGKRAPAVAASGENTGRGITPAGVSLTRGSPPARAEPREHYSFAGGHGAPRAEVLPALLGPAPAVHPSTLPDLPDAADTEIGTADSSPQLPTLSRLLDGTRFELRGDGGGGGWERLGEGLTLWGAGGYTDLEGDPSLGGGRFDYEGESFGFFVGADRRVAVELAPDRPGEFLAGAAVGWSRGDLDFADRATGTALAGEFESELVSVHPYASLRLSPRAQLWLVLGYGWGDVEITEREERRGGDFSIREVETNAAMWMASAGVEGSTELPALGEASQLALRLHATRTSSWLNRARFDDGEVLLGTRARTWRVAGDIEASYGVELPGGGQFRPFATARLRGDAGDDTARSWEFAVDLGGGAELRWPRLGVDLQLRGLAQLNDGSDHREHRVALHLAYDFGGDTRGVVASLDTSLTARRPGEAARWHGSGGGGWDRHPEPEVPGGAIGLDPTGWGGSAREGPDDLGQGLGELVRRLSGEIGYGLDAALLGTPGLLTPHTRFDLSPNERRYTAGLRFVSSGGVRLGAEAVMEVDRGESSLAPLTDYRLLLTGELPF